MIKPSLAVRIGLIFELYDLLLEGLLGLRQLRAGRAPSPELILVAALVS